MKNKILVVMNIESGCNPKAGEYSLNICGFFGALDINAFGGVDDITLIKDCVENSMDEWELPEEGDLEIILNESGEWEDVFWHKYYEVESYRVVPN